MIADLLGSAAGLALGLLVFVAPGWAIGWATDALRFRARRLEARLGVALVLSVATVPIALYFLVRGGGWGAGFAAGALVWGGTVYSLVRERPGAKGAGLFAGIGALVAGVLVLLVVDVGWGDRLYFSVVARDYLKHLALTHTLAEGGVPPLNPFFGPEGAVPLFYYYGWMLACAALDALGGALVGPRGAVFAGTAFAGLALAATAALGATRAPMRSIPGGNARSPAAPDRRPTLAALLLLVGGLDLLAFGGGAALLLLRGDPVVFTDLEWWNDPVFLWITSVLTVPHHVGGLVAAAAGCALVRDAADGRARWAGIGLGGVAFATAALCSMWVALTAAVCAAVWVGVALVRRWWGEAGAWLGAGVVAGLLALPYALDLAGAGETGGAPVMLGVREFKPLLLLGVPLTGGGALGHLLAVPLNYALEGGAMLALAALWWAWRRRSPVPLTREETFRLVVFVASLVLVTFVRSSVRSNDLGFRGIMLAQLVAVWWGADVLDALRARAVALPRWMPRPVLTTLLVLGLAATGANALVLRLVPPAADAGLVAMPGMYAPGAGELGRRTADLRAAYAWLNAHLPPGARTQHHPRPGVERTAGGFAFAPFLYGRRPVAAADDDLGTLFGVPEARYAPHARALAAIFDGRTDPAATRSLARRYNLAALVFTDLDPAWRDARHWLWSERPAFANAHARVFVLERP